MLDIIAASAVSGTLLGLTAGFAPGPLMTLVLSETLSRGTRAGLRVAAAPFITDFPVIAACFYALTWVQTSPWILGIVAVAGALYVLHLAWETWTSKPPEAGEMLAPGGSLRRGIIANFLSPHPYMFWITVGCPILVDGSQSSLWVPAAFLATFYACLAGSKILVAILTGKSRAFLTGPLYTGILKFLAVALGFFSAFFFYDAWMLFTKGSL